MFEKNIDYFVAQIGSSFSSKLNMRPYKDDLFEKNYKKSATLAKCDKIFQLAQHFESFCYENVKIEIGRASCRERV